MKDKIVEPMIFQIGEEDKEELFVIRPMFYDAEIGLRLNVATTEEDGDNVAAQTSLGII